MIQRYPHIVKNCTVGSVCAHKISSYRTLGKGNFYTATELSWSKPIKDTGFRNVACPYVENYKRAYYVSVCHVLEFIDATVSIILAAKKEQL